VATHSSLGRPVRFSRSSDHENTCCSESFGVRNSRPKGPTLRSETLRGTDRPRVEVCRSCSLVLPGPVRAEAARKALLVGADRGPVLGPARSRRGSQAGFCSESPSGRPLPERNHRRSRGVSFARHLRVGEPTALLIDGSSDPPKSGVGGFDTQTAPQRADLSKGTPQGAPGIAHRSARRGSTSPNPTTRASFLEAQEAGSGGTSADHHVEPIRRADHRQPHLLAPERRITRRTTRYYSRGSRERRAGKPTTGGHQTPRGAQLLERGRL
jgi:hypothetical protein